MTSGRAARNHVGVASRPQHGPSGLKRPLKAALAEAAVVGTSRTGGSRKMLPKRAMNGRTVSSAMPGLSVRRLHAREIALGLKQNGQISKYSRGKYGYLP